MYAIQLINMPFAALEFPSLALTQLKSVLQADHGDRVAVQVRYANQDFATLPGVSLYQEIATSVRLGMTGVGDWLFRQTAFPQLNDNSKEYFARCFPGSDGATTRLKLALLRLREDVENWLVEIIQRYALDQAALVGLTSMFAQNLACIALARKLKELNPAITVVMGGANCEFPMGRELVRHVPAVDFVFSGPALQSFSEFVRHRLEGQLDGCHTIPGVFSKRNVSSESGSLTWLTPGEADSPVVGIFGTERNLNEVVPLDYDDFLKSIARWEQIQPSLLFETSRGCWWGERAHCTFCGLNGLTMKYRSMAAESALQQFDALFQYASRLPRLTLQCVDNIIPREYLTSVLPRLRTPPNVDIFYEVKSDLSESDVAALSHARVRSIQPGIESLATSTLKLMKKGTTAFHGLSLLKRCLRYEIVPQWNLLIGFPGESAAVYEKYQRDVPLLYHLPPPTGVFPVRFDRYSPYFSQAEDYGLELRPFDFYELIYPFGADSLQRLAYFFIDNNFQSDYFVQMVNWVGPLTALVAQWRRRFSGEDGERAVLSVESHGEQSRIVDTRRGTRQVYALSSVGLRILNSLEEPLDRSRLFATVGPVEAAAFDRDLAQLVHQGCIFEEQGRMLSVVARPSQNSSSSSSARVEAAFRAQHTVST